jgi:hypothetical protein
MNDSLEVGGAPRHALLNRVGVSVPTVVKNYNHTAVGLLGCARPSALSASEDSQIGRVVRFSAHGSDSFCDRLA